MPSKSKPKSLGGQIKSATKSSSQEPVWAGPEDGGPKGGITQSMLSRFIMCRERFRLRVVEGLDVAPTFNHRLEYGSMWHVCEEWHAKDQKGDDWIRALKDYASGLCDKYRMQQEQVQHWYNVCKVQFPVYVDYWAKHPDVKNRTPLFQEQTFHVPYILPSGRKVYLRGRWDSVDLIGKGKAAGVYLQENKTKGDTKEDQLKRQLASGFDLQTMLYLIVLNFLENDGDTSVGQLPTLSHKIAGVRYNVIRRPLSGGRHSIKQTQKETPEQFYERLGGLIASEPEYFFMLWKVEVLPSDIERFRRECLDPLLEQLCDWWHWVTSPVGSKDPFSDRLHFRTPYGMYNVLAEGGSADVDEYLNTGSDVGLVRGHPLFQELS